jgi:membrane protein
MNRFPRVSKFYNQASEIWINDRPTTLAAALAYYGIFSFAPVIYIVFTVAGIFLDELAMAERLYARLAEAFGENVALAIQESISAIGPSTSGGNVLGTLIGFLALIYAASGLFYQLQYALNVIWKVPPPGRGGTLRLIRQRLFSFLIVIGLGIFLVVVAFASIAYSWLSSLFSLFDFGGATPVLILYALTALVFALIYKILPEAKIAWSDVWLGALISAALVLVGGFLVRWFLSLGKFNSALEAAGAFAVLLVMFYYFAQIFLLGAVITRVYADVLGSRRSPKNSSDHVNGE